MTLNFIPVSSPVCSKGNSMEINLKVIEGKVLFSSCIWLQCNLLSFFKKEMLTACVCTCTPYPDPTGRSSSAIVFPEMSVGVNVCPAPWLPAHHLMQFCRKGTLPFPSRPARGSSQQLSPAALGWQTAQALITVYIHLCAKSSRSLS